MRGLLQGHAARLTSRVLDSLLPRHCVLCGQFSNASNLCRPCTADLPRTNHACLHCGLPLTAACDRICGACLRKPPPWNQAVAGLVYRFPVDQLVCQFKFSRNLACGEILGSELARAVREKQGELPGIILPVPLHRMRHFQRTFNQADLLARLLGKTLGIPVHTGILRRVRRTRAQSGLVAADRRKNLKGAFVAGLSAADHVALVDDVCTTGATLAACTRALKQAGVKNVSAWMAARAPAP